MKISPNPAKHQEIIFKICKLHGIKSLELTDKHIALMDDCISEAILSLQSLENELKVCLAETLGFIEGVMDQKLLSSGIDKKPIEKIITKAKQLIK